MDDPYYLALLGDACARAGRTDSAWAAVEAGLARAPTSRKFFFESELHRLAGELLLRLGTRGEAETGEYQVQPFCNDRREALNMARGHGSPSLELRAALSLARHLRSEGQDDEARELTSRVYSTFTEGLETHDLVAARELLAQLGS
jgi:predicted ATPase